MTEYVHLIGVEQVQSAANQMNHAAEKMQQAASSFEYAMERQRMFMETWLQQFEQILSEHKP